ncbi:MAG: FAD binding domain-containing protein [Planctomycetes bacterium]|nr:FAD binding domain-containing protein [Planctomycetota bacterium]
MKNFTFYQPKTVAQVVNLLDTKWGKTEILAGGTDLLDLQKEYVAQPDKVVSLSGVAGLGNIDISQAKSGTAVKIGAGVKLAAIAEHTELKKLVPALTQTAAIVGGPQIRNIGTLGGNLCQRNRCWYFRDEHVNCLLKGGDKCFALPADAENRYHAIFTQGHKCVMVNPSTLAPVLLAFGGTVEVQGPKGIRVIDLAQFFQAPSSTGQRETVLSPDEVVISVLFGVPAGHMNASYEVRQKQSYDWPLVQAAASFNYADKKADAVRIVLGHVAPTPYVATKAQEAITGKEITEETAALAGKAAASGAKPLGQNGYKVKLVETAVKRALLAAVGKKYWE